MLDNQVYQGFFINWVYFNCSEPVLGNFIIYIITLDYDRLTKEFF